MRSATLVRAGNATLAFGILLTTVATTLLVATAPVDAAPTVQPHAKSWLTPSAVSVGWASTRDDQAPETPLEVETPAPTATPEPIVTETPAPADAPAPQAIEPSDPDFDSFKDLELTVSQTENLVNQGIRFTWKGAKPTSSGDFANNYLQIMQCWGDAASGPTPQQCQWGAPNNTIGNLTGTNAGNRDLIENEDPAQEYTDAIKRKPPRSNPNLRVFGFPFESVKGGSEFDVSSYFTSATTNEVTAARTGRDGTGSVSFEVQTSLEAPHLGCGAATSSGAARSCWLVVVPRGEHNLDGALAADTSATGRVVGSALSASAWKNRVVVKLDFQPVAASCPIGNTERRVVGSELIADAFTSWQTALCATGTTYGFSQIGDSEGRRQIVTDIDGGSKLAVVTDPLDSATAGDATLTYAPLANSAIVVGYNIDYSLRASAPNVAKNGTQVTDLVLNARLVAKLLTQSYKVDVPGLGAASPILSANPRSLVTDPEFLQLNPEFAGFASSASPDGLLVALGSSDANAHVWEWLKSDPLTASFLAGEADDWGMKINPQYLTLALATAVSDSFPKADLTTFRVAPAPEPGFGTLDLRPYMNDMHEAAYRALKSDANVKIAWDETKAPPAYVSAGPQLPGQRFMLALTDAPSAERYGLSTARLVNGAGQAVGPNASSITKAIAAMTESTYPGVRLNNPTARTLGAYPLSMPAYAAINVCDSPRSALTDYADLVEYAIGAGQTSGDAKGQLPTGYVPIEAKGIEVGKAAIAKLRKEATGKGSCAVKAPAPDPVDDFGTDFETPDDTTEPEPVPSADPEEAATHLTEDGPLSGGRLGLMGALALGIPTMAAGPWLSRRGRKLAELDE